MNERLLQFIWQFQYFNTSALQTTEGEVATIIYRGTYNTHQGPDFLDAKIKIGSTIWAGSIEIHCKTSEWKKHKHDTDKNYENVIAHIVWENDMELGHNLPTIVLQDRVARVLIEKYQQLLGVSSFIPCEKSIGDMPGITWLNWKERLLLERLEKKSSLILEYLKQNNQHWEEIFWWMIAKNFGAKINSDAFEKIARSIPFNILAKHKNQIHQIEAILFGQANLLESEFEDPYHVMLKKEYQFYKAKYKLRQPKIALFFLRMRPANFPTIRLAQLAMLIVESVHLFSKIKELRELENIKILLNVTANDYWHYHYTFKEQAAFRKKNLGSRMVDNIVINSIVPVLFAYGHYHKEQSYKQKALEWLAGIQAEKNNIVDGFSKLLISSKNAMDTQALLHLKNEYCQQKRCLECAVGNWILK